MGARKFPSKTEPQNGDIACTFTAKSAQIATLLPSLGGLSSTERKPNRYWHASLSGGRRWANFELFLRKKSKTVLFLKKSLKFAHRRPPEKEACLWRLGFLSVELNPPKLGSRVAIWADFAVNAQAIASYWRSFFGRIFANKRPAPTPCARKKRQLQCAPLQI